MSIAEKYRRLHLKIKISFNLLCLACHTFEKQLNKLTDVAKTPKRDAAYGNKS